MEKGAAGFIYPRHRLGKGAGLSSFQWKGECWGTVNRLEHDSGSVGHDDDLSLHSLSSYGSGGPGLHVVGFGGLVMVGMQGAWGLGRMVFMVKWVSLNLNGFLSSPLQ